MPIPWLQLVKYAPSILSMTNDLLQKTRRAEQPYPPPGDRRPPSAGTELDWRVDALQEDLRKQAEAMHALAKQVDGLTAVLAEVRKSLRTALTLGGAAFATALVAFIVAVAR